METNAIKNVYNNIVKDKFKGDYEHNRWFKDEQSKIGYEMTKRSIERHFLNSLSFNNYLEVGPGPGTWTSLFLKKNSKANYSLVDISAEMLKLAKNKLSQYDNVSFFESDFIKFSTSNKYDLFFSSRAIEYFPDKNRFIGRVGELLNSRGCGFIITKTPKYWSYKIMGRKVPEMHKDQIAPGALKKVLLANNFIDINLYPAVMTFPFFKSAKLNKMIYKIFYRFHLNFLSEIFSESYCVKFTKK